MKTENDFDLIILGSGSTGFAAALRAAEYGARVLMIEKSALGGTCINWGCVPSKTLVHAALFAHEAALAGNAGIAFRREPIDFRKLSAHKLEVVRRLRKAKYIDVLKGIPGLELVKGTARMISAGEVEVGGRVFRSERILIATGGAPRVPPLEGLQEIDWITSREALLLSRFPESLIVMGGGVIAVELGQMFRRLGTQVTLVERGPRIIPQVEAEPSQELSLSLADEGVRILSGTGVCRAYRSGGASCIEVDRGGERAVLQAEKVLLAVGTSPATGGLGLENAGVALDRRGFVVVDDRMRTSADGVWAAGDVTGGMMIATAGAREGAVAVDDMFNPGCGCVVEPLAVPMSIFTDPEVATVGYTEAGAVGAGFRVCSRTIPITAVAKAHVTGHMRGCVKMVAEEGSGRILGVHLASHRGADIINEAALAVRFRLTVQDLAGTLHVYPSMGECLRLCAQAFRRDVRTLSCCAE